MLARLYVCWREGGTQEAAYGALAEEMKVQEEKTSFAMEELVSLRQEHLGVQAEFQDLQKRYTVSQV